MLTYFNSLYMWISVCKKNPLNSSVNSTCRLACPSQAMASRKWAKTSQKLNNIDLDIEWYRYMMIYVIYFRPFFGGVCERVRSFTLFHDEPWPARKAMELRLGWCQESDSRSHEIRSISSCYSNLPCKISGMCGTAELLHRIFPRNSSKQPAPYTWWCRGIDKNICWFMKGSWRMTEWSHGKQGVLAGLGWFGWAGGPPTPKIQIR